MRTFILSAIATLFALFCVMPCSVAQVDTNRMMQVGRNALYFEDYVLSIQYFNRVINVKPYLADPYYYRAIAKFYLDDLSGAESDCDIALGINPFLVSAYNLRGIAKLRQHRNADASADFEAGLKFEPDNVNLMMNNGVACINLKDYDKAISQYDSLLKHDKKNISAILYRGIALVEKGDTVSALSEFKRAAEINRYSPDAFTYLGMLAYQMHDFDDALVYYDKLAELKPKDAFVYVNRAITRYNLDDLRGCMDDLDEALRLEPRNILALQNRGILRAQTGDLNRAADDFSKLLAIDPSDDIALFNRANIYVELGQTTNAMRDLNIIIAKHPEFGPAYAQRATVKRTMGDSKGAEVDYMTYVTFEEDRRKRGLQAGQDADGGSDAEPDDGKNSHRASRSKNDNDLTKYDQMVVVADFGDNDEKLSTENKDKIRGRVQDRDVVIDLEPVFGLTFFSADTVLPNAKYFKRSVEALNARGISNRKVLISNRELTAEGISAQIFDEISVISHDIESQPANPNLYMVRGLLYSSVLNYNSAIADFSVAILRDPDDVNALFSRAATRYRMVEVIRSMDTDVNQVGGELLGNRDVRTDVTFLDYDLIQKDLEHVLEVEPGNEFAYYNLSLVLCQRKQFDKALGLLDMAISLNPQFAEAYFNRGIINIFLGHDDLGRSDLSKAGELGIFKAYNVIKRYGNDSVESDD